MAVCSTVCAWSILLPQQMPKQSKRCGGADAMAHPLLTHSVRAFNGAAASENKIHDDTVARRFGFAGALVPGVAVFAYMAHVPVAHFGRTWLECGQAECRFLKPVYDGDIARVTA